MPLDTVARTIRQALLRGVVPPAVALMALAIMAPMSARGEVPAIEAAPTAEAAPAQPAGASAPADPGVAAAAPPEMEPVVRPDGSINVQAALAERAIGAPDAPVVMVEYSSLTCPHCAALNKEVLPALKRDYVDTGRVRLVKRDFPIDQVALMAAAAARCVRPDYYFRFIEALFIDQASWARSSDPAQSVMNMAALLGMEPATFDACIGDEALLRGILTGVQEAQSRYEISATPTVVLNNGAEIISGARPLEVYTAVIDRLLAANGAQ